jgi:hypothetical protein
VEKLTLTLRSTELRALQQQRDLQYADVVHAI